MNICVLSGFLQKKTQYIKNDTGESEFRFFLNVYSPVEKTMNCLPILCKGKLADECYARLKVGYYLEVIGEMVRPSPQQVFAIAHTLSFKTPTGEKVVHIRTTEFLEMFDTSKVLERLQVDKSGKKKR